MQKYIKTFCWGLLLTISGCQERSRTDTNKPDAVRDLLIDRSFWQTKTTAQPQSKGINVHRLTITNTSHQYTYRHIDVRFDYYNRDHQKIDSSIRTIDQTIEPRAAVTIDPIEANQTKEGTTAATATIIEALTD